MSAIEKAVVLEPKPSYRLMSPQERRQLLGWLMVRVTRGLRIDPLQLGTEARMDIAADNALRKDTLATYIAGADHRAEMAADEVRARRLAQRKGKVRPDR